MNWRASQGQTLSARDLDPAGATPAAPVERDENRSRDRPFAATMRATPLVVDGV